MKLSYLLSITMTSTLALLACGSDDDTSDATTTSSSSTMDSSASSGQGGAATTTGEGGATTTTGEGGAATTTGEGGAATTSGQGGAGSGSGGGNTAGAGGAGDPEVNGCTRATAMDMTNQKSVELPAWDFGHTACILVTGGTQVVWKGNFQTHPLAGGVAGMKDDASPISKAMVASDTATVVLPADQGKDYPYFCSIHTSMKGVVYTAE